MRRLEGREDVPLVTEFSVGYELGTIPGQTVFGSRVRAGSLKPSQHSVKPNQQGASWALKPAEASGRSPSSKPGTR